MLGLSEISKVQTKGSPFGRVFDSMQLLAVGGAELATFTSFTVAARDVAWPLLRKLVKEQRRERRSDPERKAGDMRALTLHISKDASLGYGMAIDDSCFVSGFNDEGTAAEMGGVTLGARIVSVNDTAVSCLEDVQAILPSLEPPEAVFGFELPLATKPAQQVSGHAVKWYCFHISASGSVWRDVMSHV